MKLLFRLIDGTGTPQDVCVEVADDVRVGELADALADRFGAASGSTISTRWPRPEHDRVLSRDALVTERGPRLGATIELVAEREAPPAQAVPSPVELFTPDGQPLRLAFGTNELPGVRVDVEHQVVARAVGGPAVAINGERLLGSCRLANGDLVTVGGRTWSVRVEGPLRPPAPEGPTIPHRRSPRRLPRPAPVTVELPTPPPALRLPGFPVLSASVPLLMGGALWFATRSIASVVFVLFSFVFVVASGLEARRETRAERRFRIEEFRADLDLADERIRELRGAQTERAARHAPGVGAAAAAVQGQRSRLWEAADGVALVRLGTGAVEPFDPVRAPTGGDRSLRAELRSVLTAAERLEGPVTIDLDRMNGLAVIGPDESATGVARSVVLQLATLLSPEQLRIEVLTEPGREHRWQWCRWLPHCDRRAPLHLLVVDGLDAENLAQTSPGRRALLWIAPRDAGVPDSIRAVLRLDGPHGARLLRHDDEHGWSDEPLRELEIASEDETEPVARLLAPVRLHRELDQAADHGTVSLRNVLCDPAMLDESDVVRRTWRSARRGHLAAPIGRSCGGLVQLDLCSDGPHALIAGTTGSGKSELLRTLILSLALHHPPSALTFLLVDYKGGAAFGELDALPHTVGTITDLSGSLAQRALTSLRAEVRRREEVLARHGCSSLTELPRVQELPALAVVVDEFATLARELPEFVDGLVDVAQRGRSLGVHLILATQRPAGVVSDAIRANTTLRLALRVADEDDSRDVVDAADAAALPRDRPGRAIVRVGPGSTVEVQTAYSGAPATTPPRIRFEGCDVTPPAGGTELNSAIATVRAAASESAPVRRPWLDPLPDRIELGSLPADVDPGCLSIGMVDLPATQDQQPLVVDLASSGGVLICGASGSGRSSVLACMAAAAARHGGERLTVHGIDAGRALHTADDQGLLGDAVDVHDHERVLRLLRAVAGEVRDGRGAAPRRLLLLDGFAAFEEAHEQLNRGEALELLMRIAREGRSARVHLAVTAARSTELPVSLRAALGTVVQLRCANEDDAAIAGLPVSAADRELPPGRGLVDGETVQLGAPDGLVHAVGRRVEPQRIGRLPHDVPLAALTGNPEELQPTLGIDADRLGPMSLDLTHQHALIVGPPRSGRTTALGTLSHGVPLAYLLRAADGPEPTGEWTDRHDHSVETGPGPVTAIVEQAIDAAHRSPTLLAVDDLVDLLEGDDAVAIEAALLAVLDAARRLPIRMVAAGEVDAITRCYGALIGRLRSGRTGLVLQGDPELHASLLHATVRARAELPSRPGRGWLIHPTTTCVVQVARSSSHGA